MMLPFVQEKEERKKEEWRKGEDGRKRGKEVRKERAGHRKPGRKHHLPIHPEIEVKVVQSCPALCDPMDYTVHGILQARILESVAIPFSRGSSQPRDWTQVSRIAGRFLTSQATREAAEPPGNSPWRLEKLHFSGSRGRIWTGCFHRCPRFSADAVRAVSVPGGTHRANPFRLASYPR